MARPTRDQWAIALELLRRVADQDEDITAEVNLAAARLGVSARTVWRRLASEFSDRPKFTLSQTDIDAFVDARGNVAAVHRQRAAALAGRDEVFGAPINAEFLAGWVDAAPVTLRTLQRAFLQELTPAFIAGATGGERKRRTKLVYLSRRAGYRNKVWEGDHKNLPILVLPKRGKAITPWVTMFIDDATRVITGWAISDRPHAGTVLTALRMGMVNDPFLGPAHGVPGLLRLDKGLEFAAESVTTATAALDTECRQMEPYAPNKKGKIERVFLTVEQTLLCTLPGYTEGARLVNGQLAGPLDDRAKAREAYGEAAEAGADVPLPLGIETFAHLFRKWVNAYNTEHRHSELGGRTPAQAWADDPTPTDDIPEPFLRHLLLATAPRRIGPMGIRHHSLSWIDPGGLIRERRGQHVLIRYMPHDDREIHVYLDGQFLATAHPRDALSPEEEERYYAAARAQERKANAERTAARQRARRRLSTLSAGEEKAEPVRGIPVAKAEQVFARDRPDLRNEASTSMLGLGPIRAIEPIDLADLDTLGRADERED